MCANSCRTNCCRCSTDFGARVNNDVITVGREPDRAQPVVVSDLSKFYNPKATLSSLLDDSVEVVKGEGFAQGKIREGRRDGPFDIHLVLTSLRALGSTGSAT